MCVPPQGPVRQLKRCQKAPKGDLGSYLFDSITLFPAEISAMHSCCENPILLYHKESVSR